MALTLRLSGGGGSGQTKLLSTGTLSIGRGAGNDWVLPDPDRTLSKTHCVISVENGRYILTDLSTNGVHINGARQATARDSRVELTDGDSFRMGEFTIAVNEVEDAHAGHRAGPATLDPFASPAGRGGHGDPFEAGAGPDEGRSPLDIDPLDDPLGRAPDPAFRHPIAQPQIGRRAEDPFDRDEENKRRPIDPDDDLFSGVKPSHTWQGPSQPDHADAPRHAFTPPRVIQPVQAGAIDFDALIGDIAPLDMPASAQPPPSQRPPAARAQPQPGRHDPFADLDGLLAPTPAPTVVPEVASPLPPQGVSPLSPQVISPLSLQPAPVPPSPAVHPPPPAVSDDPFAELERASAPVSRQAPSQPVPAAAPAAAPAAGPATDGRAALAAFLEGAGVSGLPAGADPEATLRAVGQVFRAMTEGLREVLMSRAAIKSDMRVEQTMIQAKNNNALKFSVTVDDAVSALLNPSRPGYMPPLAATKEAFNDLKSHELAVMSGVQTALMGLLERFDPATLETRLAQGLLGAVLPAARKARYWDSFRQVYGEIAKEAEDDFQAVFGRNFARAYSAQTRRASED